MHSIEILLTPYGWEILICGQRYDYDIQSFEDVIPKVRFLIEQRMKELQIPDCAVGHSDSICINCGIPEYEVKQQ